MSDQSLDNEVMDVAATGSLAQAGELLRDAREAQGLHIAALAVALKVPVKKLEALEAGRFEQLPDMVFVRSLALSVCRALKIDPAPIMAGLPEPQVSQYKISEPGLNTTFKDSAGVSHRGVMAQISSPIGLGVLFLVVAIAAILAWPDKPFFETGSSVTSAVSEPVVAEPQNVQAPPVSESAADASSAVASATAPAPAVVQSSAQAAVQSPVVPVSKVAAAVPANVSAVAVVPDVIVPPSVLELSGRGESWVEVTDAAGQSRLRKIIQNGETIRVVGQPPLSVTVGRADMVSVSVRGKPMDITPLARENVARFEVK